tara:strand:+ start:160 stop:714 length:555 start_codon:yes stop_codon:yes gene_type:complete
MSRYKRVGDVIEESSKTAVNSAASAVAKRGGNVVEESSKTAVKSAAKTRWNNAVDKIKFKNIDTNKALRNRFTGKSSSQIDQASDVANKSWKNSEIVQKYKKWLEKIGIYGPPGLAALMLFYGTFNPKEAIEKAMKDSGDAGEIIRDGAFNIGNLLKDLTDPTFLKVGLIIFAVVMLIVFIKGD